MSRLYDRIGRFGFTGLGKQGLPTAMAEESEEIRRSLSAKAPVVISADNVARYYEEHAHGGFAFDLAQDVPNLAPPFPRFFVETENPDILDAQRRRDGTAGPGVVKSWGVYFEARDLKEEFGADLWEEEAEGETLAAYRGGFPIGTARVREGADAEMMRHARSGLARPPRWHVASALFVEYGGRRTVEGPIYANLAAIDQGGTVAKWNTGREVQLHRPYTSSAYNAKDYFGVITEFFYPTYLAIAFMHCANVARKQIVPEAEKLSKKAKKRGKQPRPPETRYYVLDIDPMREVLDTEGRAGEEGLKRALHITRGHFKHYTPERGGPFGREIAENTTVWTRQHVRGTKERGRVEKDYRVNPPDGRTYSPIDKSSGENGGDPSDEGEVR